MNRIKRPVPWLAQGEEFPALCSAWGADAAAPGLLAAGGDLGVDSLVRAYSAGIFPWFSAGQPILWWSPDPRMVLRVENFRLSRSLRKTLKHWLLHPGFELTFDRDFSQVIHRCSTAPRAGQNGTWIVPAMVAAYEDLHRQGFAHSAEVWLDGELVAGLYFVALGHAVFGESMFTTVNDGSKMALASLVSVCRTHGVSAIDCQQNTRHLASLGAQEMPRDDFLALVQHGRQKPPIDWRTQTLYWHALTPMDTQS